MIKNVGVLVSLLTLCVGLWHVMLNLHFLMIDGEKVFFLRLIGVILITIFAYMPYYLLCKIISKMKYKSVIYGVGVGFLFGDIILKLNIVFDIFHIFDFVSMVAYAMLGMGIFTIIGILDITIQKYELRKRVSCMLNFNVIRKVTSFVFSK